MKQVVTPSGLTTALHSRRAACARVLLLAVLVAGLLASVSASPISVFAGDWGTDTSSDSGDEAEDTEEETPVPVVEQPEIVDEPTEEPTEFPTVAPEPTPIPTEPPALEPVPSLTLIATADCTLEGGYIGLLTLPVADASVVITDVLVLAETGVLVPARLAVLLPAVLDPGSLGWQWWLNAPTGERAPIVPSSLLVHIEQHQGDELANQTAADGRTGWVFASFELPVLPCPLPTPVVELTPTPTGDTTGGESAGSEAAPISTPEPEATPSPGVTPEPTATPSPATIPPTPEPTPDATETPTPSPSPTPEATATPTPDPAPTEPVNPDPIEVEARSADRSVQPGDVARYRFRVTNTTDRPIVIILKTIDSVEGWTSRVFTSDGKMALPDTVRLDAGASIDVIVRVYPPVDVRAGDENSTRLKAILFEPPGY